MTKRKVWRAAALGGFAFCLLAPRVGAARAPRACSATTNAAFNACNKATQDDFDTALGICANVSDPDAQRSCLSDAQSERRDGLQSCREQRDARNEVCDALGEGPYDPGFDPAGFDSDFAHLTHPNPLFPLQPGDQWTYASDSELDHVEIRNATKAIEGVTCVVSHDVVRDKASGAVTEDTDDWIAQAKSGDVLYCGEQSKELETFAGDDPNEPELVGIEGSFKVGRDGAKPGILMLAHPTVGALYRQEFALGDAEDVAEVLSTTYRYGQDPDLDQNVPQALAELLCGDGNCLVTRDFSPLEPDAIERKYYAPGIGDFLEIDLDTGEVTQLVDCNFDPRCAMLPTP